MTDTSRSRWSYLSNHGHVIVYLARNPRARLRDIAAAVGITERAIQRLIVDLEKAGVVQRTREGRRNRYLINEDLALRHPLEATTTVGSLIDTVNYDVAVEGDAKVAAVRPAPVADRRQAGGRMTAAEMERIRRAAQFRFG